MKQIEHVSFVRHQQHEQVLSRIVQNDVKRYELMFANTTGAVPVCNNWFMSSLSGTGTSEGGGTATA
jgi:hypothetical protein